MNSCRGATRFRLVIGFNDARSATITPQIVQRGIDATPFNKNHMLVLVR